MATQKFLFLYRAPHTSAAKPPSPEQMQEMFAQWQKWKAKFNQEIIDLGDALKSGGTVYKGGSLSDGPFIEAKEVLAGYSIVTAPTLERAVEVAKECPMNFMPGSSIEIREMLGY